jgi:hypothetical protein
MVEAVRSLLKRRAGVVFRDKLPGQHGWVHGLPLRVRFRRSKIYVSVLPVLAIGLGIGFLGALLGIGGGFILVPALIYTLRIPGSVVIGTSLVQVMAIMAAATILHAVNSQSVDILLAFCLMVGGVIGAQFGASAGQRLRGDQLRAMLAAIVLAVALRFAFSLLVEPSDPWSMALVPGMGA